ncbi:MAG: hypothetical protein Q7R31_01875 [Candidatus Levybacteria bacterium]|nr:hypothetical protein [Candidatus Levybacteria bacterium]
MRKSLGFISALSLYASSAFLAIAQGAAPKGDVSIPIVVPTGALPLDLDIGKLPQFIITLLFIVGVIIAIAFLIYGGIKWVMSGGDKAGVEAARNHIVAAIIGLVIIAAAFFIIQVVFRLLGTSLDISTLTIPTLKQ